MREDPCWGRDGMQRPRGAGKHMEILVSMDVFREREWGPEVVPDTSGEHRICLGMVGG